MYGKHWINIENLDGWDVSIEKVVGGFIWLGFSRDNPEKMLCISSDKATIFDCKKGTVTTTDCAYDEDKLLAIAYDLNDEIAIAGQYGGSYMRHSKYLGVIQIDKSIMKTLDDDDISTILTYCTDALDRYWK